MSNKQRLEDSVILYGKPGKRTEKAKILLETAGLPYRFSDLSQARSYDPEFEPLPSLMGRLSGFESFHGLNGVRDYIAIYKAMKIQF